VNTGSVGINIFVEFMQLNVELPDGPTQTKAQQPLIVRAVRAIVPFGMQYPTPARRLGKRAKIRHAITKYKTRIRSAIAFTPAH
jgi:hypothetical protein